MLYFAYGSNLSQPRMLARLPQAVYLGVARLPGYQFQLNKRGADDSAKANIIMSDDPDASVYGVLYLMGDDEKLLLDSLEGEGYRSEEVAVEGPENTILDAFAYIALEPVIGLIPYDWYLRHIIHGAKQSGLPQAYVYQLKQTGTQRDHNASRSCLELSVYTSYL